MFSAVALFLLLGEATAGRMKQSNEPRAEISEAPSDISGFNLTIFNQLIDHGNPSLGTFEQRVYSNDEYYGGTGSPVVMFSPGEGDASTYPNYMTNRKINGAFAEVLGGAIVMVEHRYFGESSPFEELTTKNLQYLNTNNSLKDFTNIAETIQLPFDSTNSSQAGVAPWVYVGGSYVGSLAVWTEVLYPGTFWAYYASSAILENIWDFWEYYDPIRQGMPANCSKDVELVINHVDSVLSSGDETNITALKTMFGLEDLEYLDDFASLFVDGPSLAQDDGFYVYDGYNTFNEWCDYIETAASPGAAVPDADGVGLEKALAGYANWSKTVNVVTKCSDDGYAEWQYPSSLGCWDSHNITSPYYTDISVANNSTRQWEWLGCSEFANWKLGGGTPADIPAIVTRFLNYTYYSNQCDLYFPPEDDGNGGMFSYNGAYVDSGHDVEVFQKQLDAFNKWTKGWDIEGLTDRVAFAVGEFDPWLALTVSSTIRPGGPINSTAKQPIFTVPGAFHTTDLDMLNGEANAGIEAVQSAAIAQIKTWVEEYYEK